MTGVTVIVPIYDGLAYLPAFFSTMDAALPPRSQVIVIDDGSNQPVLDAVPELSNAAEVLRLRNDCNLGYSASVNRGFEAATGDVIVQLNADLVLDPGCITAMVDLIEDQPDVGIVGSKLVYPTTGLVQHIGMAFGDHSHRHIYMELPSEHPLCLRTRQMQFQTGATAAMTRRVLNAVGPLDEDLYNANADLDHCLKVAAAGYRNFTCAESVAFHWETVSGPIRFAGKRAAEARFWARWGGRYDVDLGRFVDEALDHVLNEHPGLEHTPFELVDLTRGGDQPLVLEALAQRWPGVEDRCRSHRQRANEAARFSLPLLLPHWMVTQPKPFIYMVDRYRELEDNVLWFEQRSQVVREELIVDLTGVVLPVSEAFPRRAARGSVGQYGT